MAKFLFITGGVVSSLGKGITTASLGALLQSHGYTVRLRKLDPYLNIDPGTMSPYQHGEVFVTEDAAETDLDLGHYERFTEIPAKKTDSVTTGKIYSELLTKEREGYYLGKTVQVIPHVTDLIKKFILYESEKVDFVLCEIGGTVGDIEGLPYFEAIRQLGYELGLANVIYIHLTLIPYLHTAREIKTKPTQHSVKELRSIGIQPNIIICRSEKNIPIEERKKIGLFCNVKEECVIGAVDQKSIYYVPIAYLEENLDKKILKLLNLPAKENPDVSKWLKIKEKIDNPKYSICIGIIGKYNTYQDAYKSLIEAFAHAGIYHECKIKLKWIDIGELNSQNLDKIFKNIDGIMVPGGFGKRGSEEKITAIKYARENKIPFFGICLGMQLAILEYARNVANIKDAGSREFDKNCMNVIDISQTESTNKNLIGGTMRLGGYTCKLKKGSLAHSTYNLDIISERHRHRYEFNLEFSNDIMNNDLIVSGMCSKNKFVEIVELINHPWFMAVQFHPELKSTPFSPHPLFISFIRYILNNKTA